MGAFSRPMLSPGSLSNLTHFVNTSKLPVETHVQPLPKERAPEDKTDLVFAGAIMGAILVIFVGIVLVDLCRKHAPRRDPNGGNFINRLYATSMADRNNRFTRLFTKQKKRGGDVESAAAGEDESLAAVDRLATDSSKTVPGLLAKDEAKSVGPMANVDVTVTPLEMPFLQSIKEEDMNVVDNGEAAGVWS
ncbi:hypothetical protein TARUN_5249 [Trichoderma arundinaceum]|uniref:Uncharacterized protein n=1 Tax=Trichoderma arundinaceum TaxID=490622 RepID=A0A395NLP0_TRIAR|nr:hypothetical protein TARUN_5249 [Trichoderma arundinaceum]